VDLIKKHKCVTGIIVIILLVALYYCWANNWLYYYFDVVAKCSPAIAGVGAYYMWSENREREIKELEYKNDYYKKVIDKRIAAYEILEEIISIFECFYANTQHAEAVYRHSCFLNSFTVSKAVQTICKIDRYSLWISQSISYKVLELNKILLAASSKSITDTLPEDKDADNEIVKYGRENYEEVNKLRDQLKEIIAEDMLNLHDVGSFLKKKQKNKNDVC